MVIIKAIKDSTGGIYPETPIPESAVLVIGTADSYMCYFDGEETPFDVPPELTEDNLLAQGSS